MAAYPRHRPPASARDNRGLRNHRPKAANCRRSTSGTQGPLPDQEAAVRRAHLMGPGLTRVGHHDAPTEYGLRQVDWLHSHPAQRSQWRPGFISMGMTTCKVLCRKESKSHFQFESPLSRRSKFNAMNSRERHIRVLESPLSLKTQYIITFF